MDELLRDFLTETAEHLEGVETQLVAFERNPRDASLVASIFRLVHTIKGTSSFLGLHRLQRVGHSAETLIGELRDGAPPTQRKVSLILAAIDRIKSVVSEIEQLGAEPDGDDSELIAALEASVNDSADAASEPASAASEANVEAPEAEDEDRDDEEDEDPAAEQLPMKGTADTPPAVSKPAGGDGDGQPASRNLPAPAGGGGGAREGAGTAARSAETIRVAVDTIERIMQLVSELVLTRNQLLELTRHRENDQVKAPLQRLSGLTTDLQDAVMRARMQPVGRLFSGLPRLVRELCAELGKKIDLVTDGADTELDRQLIEVLRDPLTHLIRNCADHGIETPDERVANGKPEFGEIRVSASHEAGQITIAIADDGRGLNLERIKAKAIATGMATEQTLAAMSTEEINRFIFEPGFSTAAKVTGVSGRGVGMDVVRSNIESIGGSVSLTSVPGGGTRFSLRIPLTLAIAPALIVKVGTERFALPQSAVVEAVGLGSDSRHTIDRVQNALVLKLREEVVPVLDLNSILCLNEEEDDDITDQLVVILRVGGGTLGVRVDAVLDVQEIVVKPLNPSLAHLKIFTGQTILGDGSVVLILDPSGVAQELGLEAGEKKREAAKETFSSEERTRLVLFRAGHGLPKVLPLSLLARIEMVEADRIERSDNHFLMLHHGRLMPLLPLAPMHEITAKAHPVLVITAQDRTIGLLVDEIIDILEEKLEVQLTSETGDIVGSAEIRGEPVELIDVTYYMQMAFSSLAQPDPKHILYADNDPFFRDTLLPVLKGAGYRVTATLSAEDAIELLEGGTRFDGLLIDSEMPSKTGAVLASVLREKAGDDMPILLLHELATPAVLNLSSSHRMTGNASKLDRQYLLNTLATFLTLNERNEGGYMTREMAA